LKSSWSTWKNLRRIQPDLVVDLEYFSKMSTVFCGSVGARYRLGFLLPAHWRSRLLDGGIAFREDIHFSEAVARLLHPWGVPYHVPTSPATLTISDETQQAAGRWLRKLSDDDKEHPHAPPLGVERKAPVLSFAPTGQQWIMLNPHAHDLCLERRWPREYFVKLVESLAGIGPEFIFGILGNRSEREYSERLKQEIDEQIHGRVHVLAGRTSLPQLAAVLNLSRLLVTNDSGIMHVGAAVRIPLVALFGPESAKRYAPLAPAERVRILHHDIVCGPCLSYMNRKTAPCRGDNRCMRELSVESVTRACLDLLETTGPRKKKSRKTQPLKQSPPADRATQVSSRSLLDVLDEDTGILSTGDGGEQ
jgi:ADP-heptose:LPS heptosyltransferase